MNNQIIITDGIINKAIFVKESVRLLWVLKEANDTESTEGWDMRKFLRERSSAEGLFKYSKWRSTFGLICKISHGILDSKLSYDEINNYNGETLAKVLDRIAYINVKKVPGGSVVNYDTFNAYISNPSYLTCLKKQIAEINPHIVICGNTFQYLFPDIVFNLNTEWLYKENGITYVNGWHPNARIDHKKYFNDIRYQLRIK